MLASATIGAHGSQVVKWTGDGHLATVDGPGTRGALRQELLASAEGDGLRLRAGVHTGEVERLSNDVAAAGAFVTGHGRAVARVGCADGRRARSRRISRARRSDR